MAWCSACTFERFLAFGTNEFRNNQWSSEAGVELTAHKKRQDTSLLNCSFSALSFCRDEKKFGERICRVC